MEKTGAESINIQGQEAVLNLGRMLRNSSKGYSEKEHNKQLMNLRA